MVFFPALIYSGQNEQGRSFQVLKMNFKIHLPGLLAFALLTFLPTLLPAHGGVVAEEDLCIIQIGFFRAHFTVYQPENSGGEEFCEDIPDVEQTIFVLDYMHNSLKQVPVDFRIIKDVQKRTLYASWEDIQKIDDLDAATVFYQPPAVKPDGSFQVEHTFLESGWYTGIVTTRHPTLDKKYQAVFGFYVGGRGLGYWWWLILIAIFGQSIYWIANGGLTRLRKKPADGVTDP